MLCMVVSLYHADYKDIRALLRRARLGAGFTQMQMAIALDVGQSYVSKLERGENFVDVLLYARWCHACGVRPGSALDELFEPHETSG